MNISSISSAPSAGAISNSAKSKQPNKSEHPEQLVGQAFRLDITAKLQVASLQATYGPPLPVEAANTEATGEVTGNPEHNDKASLLKVKEEIRSQVKMQTIALLRSYMTDNPELKDSLATFFRDNPDALKDISQGEIPSYFNVDNTAGRILDIYFARYDGGDRTEFVTRAKEIINQAYTEVEGELGSLPGIVYSTRDKVMEILDKFESGEDVSGIVNIPKPEANEIV